MPAIKPATETSLDLLTRREAADMIRVAPNTLEVWRREGKGPPTLKLGGRYRYPRDLFEKWIQDSAS